MNYLEVSKTCWEVVHAEAPQFFNRRIAALVAARYLEPAGGDRYRTSYRVIGGNEEYMTGADTLLRNAQ